jgi:DNA-binding transcriptional LysR family regulator
VQTIKALVAQNIGVGILMDLVVKNDPSLVAIPLAEPVIIEIGIAWRKGSCLSNAAHAFIKFIDLHFKNSNK